MILLLGDAIISLGFDKMSAVMCTEHKHILRHQHALEIRGKLKHAFGTPIFEASSVFFVCVLVDVWIII